ncbi:MAG: hypothetical protein Q9159_000892 [Coniocarpon cinnabarinum]
MLLYPSHLQDDDTARCHGEIRKVHKFVLQMRGQYFRAMFNHSELTENVKSELALDDSEISPDALDALLQVLYMDRYTLRVTTGDMEPGDMFEVSSLGNRFLVKGIDDVVIWNLFDSLELYHYSVFELDEVWEEKRSLDAPHRFHLRTDNDFLDRMADLLHNAVHSESTRAMNSLTRFFADHFHFLHRNSNVRERLFDKFNTLEDAIKLEVLHGPLRLMCPECHLIKRVQARDLFKRDRRDEKYCKECEYVTGGVTDWIIEWRRVGGRE